MTAKKNKSPNSRGSPAHLSLQVKLTVQSNPSGFPNNLVSIIDSIMAAHGGEPYTEGTSLISGDVDFIYDFERVNDESKLMDDLRDGVSLALNYQWTLESFALWDAYPGDASLYGYKSGHLVRQKR